MPHFVTSRQDEDHVTSANVAHLTAGLLGNGCYVLPIGQKLACTMTDSNTLRVLFGVASVCGRQWEIEGDYEEVNIDNGVPGYNRVDLLVCRVETAPQETIALKVYKGEETTGAPVVPGHVEGDLNDGDTVCEMPICSVRVNGINPQAPEMLAKESIDIMALLKALDDHKKDFGDYKSQMKTAGGIDAGGVAGLKLADGAVTSSKIADGAVGTSDLAAKAVTGAKIADGVLPSRSKQTMNPMTIERYGNVRIITVLYTNTSLVANYEYSVGTLPAGDRPQTFTRGIAASTAGGGMLLNVNTNGSVVLSTAANAATSNANVQALAVYTVA